MGDNIQSINGIKNVANIVKNKKKLKNNPFLAKI